MDKPPYTPDRFQRCAAHYIRWRGMEIGEPSAAVSALARYWWKEAQKAYPQTTRVSVSGETG